MESQDIVNDFARAIGSDDPGYVEVVKKELKSAIDELVTRSVADMRQQKDQLMDRWKSEQEKRLAYGALLLKCVEVMHQWIVPDGITAEKAMNEMTGILDNREAFKVLSPDIVKPRASSYDPA